ncbi:Macrolide export ATP-binding/permease protein MacB [Actinomadura sp. RB68]|uniref:Macrolide export ATP-binding/permease protein MacB n=1 Tax=Actinomadura macrotermitis TaxID=2585200 RepID=A0A7K0BXD0_9ACTN|nr:Macrolide export ATP-binding/permease protein MacB [Actinomadura macrotermitis]
MIRVLHGDLSPRAWQSGARPSRLSWRDLISEATAGLTQRPGRSALTMLGTILGVSAFVAVLGLTATTSGQISQQFNVLTATTLTVSATADRAIEANSPNQPGQGDGAQAQAFPRDADHRITRLHGVVHAGTWRRIRFPGAVSITASPATRPGANGDIGAISSVLAASPGTLEAAEATVTQGTQYNAFHEARSELVAILGATAAQRLGITQLDSRPAVFINHRAFTVIGILGDTRQMPELLSSVLIPRSTADRVYGPPPQNNQGQMIIKTQLGAARLIASQAPTALRPDNPALFTAIPPPDPRGLHHQVTSDLTGLFLLLAAICLVIGAVGIANTTFVSVLERTGEIGLRRSLGARPCHIAIQFLTESTVLGLLGGMIGTSIAIGIVVVVALAQQWTAVLEPFTVLPAPLIGAFIGLLAGLYPALRAARIEPQEALRQ